MPEPLKANARLLTLMGETRSIFVFNKILHLGVMLTDWAEICEPLDEFLENLDEQTVKDLAPQLDLGRVLQQFDEDEDKDEARSNLAWCCRDQNRWGFLADVRAPETIKLPSGGRNVHLGICRCRWLYGETLADLVKQAERWAREQEKKGPIIKPATAPDDVDED